MIFTTTQAEKIVGRMSTRYSWLWSKTKDIVDAKISRIARHEDCLSSTRRSMEILLSCVFNCHVSSKFFSFLTNVPFHSAHPNMFLLQLHYILTSQTELQCPNPPCHVGCQHDPTMPKCIQVLLISVLKSKARIFSQRLQFHEGGLNKLKTRNQLQKQKQELSVLLLTKESPSTKSLSTQLPRESSLQ